MQSARRARGAARAARRDRYRRCVYTARPGRGADCSGRWTSRRPRSSARGRPGARWNCSAAPSVVDAANRAPGTGRVAHRARGRCRPRRGRVGRGARRRAARAGRSVVGNGERAANAGAGRVARQTCARAPRAESARREGGRPRRERRARGAGREPDGAPGLFSGLPRRTNSRTNLPDYFPD